jgi:hypothetical protein
MNSLVVAFPGGILAALEGCVVVLMFRLGAAPDASRRAAGIH